jgi:hypothetical protein
LSNAIRIVHLRRFYEILADLESKLGGMRQLAQCSGHTTWPQRGVYFFFERGEMRFCSGAGLRVVRVGTHAISHGACTTLWNRLAQHKGTNKLSGNHRGSVFRKLVGQAFAARDPNIAVSSWGKGSSAKRNIREEERSLEIAVSRYIGEMPLLWLTVEDPASTQSRRSYIERNAIALLSDALTAPGESPDPPSTEWLGLDCPHLDVARSGLWNSNHIAEQYEPQFLDELERLVAK